MRSNRLAILAGEIRAAHDAATSAMQDAVEHGREAGKRLLEAKALLRNDKGPGQWLAYLKATDLPASTARRYMALAKRKVSEPPTVSDLDIESCLDAFSLSDESDDEPDDDEEPSAPPEWTDDQLERKKRAEHGECVVANMREIDGQRRDEALLQWAEADDRFVRIDRQTRWGNRFEMPEDGERAEVIGKFEKFYLPHKDGLLADISNLVGKVLVCWCYLEQCHGDVIATVVNEDGSSCRSPHEVAEELAEQDG
jgi:hypothetical protein